MTINSARVKKSGAPNNGAPPIQALCMRAFTFPVCSAVKMVRAQCWQAWATPPYRRHKCMRPPLEGNGMGIGPGSRHGQNVHPQPIPPRTGFPDFPDFRVGNGTASPCSHRCLYLYQNPHPCRYRWLPRREKPKPRKFRLTGSEMQQPSQPIISFPNNRYSSCPHHDVKAAPLHD